MNKVWNQIIAWAGSQANLARKLNITPQNVSAWKGSIPELYAYRIERLSGGRWKAEAICPDVKRWMK